MKTLNIRSRVLYTLSAAMLAAALIVSPSGVPQAQATQDYTNAYTYSNVEVTFTTNRTLYSAKPYIKWKLHDWSNWNNIWQVNIKAKNLSGSVLGSYYANSTYGLPVAYGTYPLGGAISGTPVTFRISSMWNQSSGGSYKTWWGWIIYNE